MFRRDQIKDLLTFNSFCLTAIISQTSQFIPYLDVFKVPLRVTLGISPLNLRLVPRKHSDAASYPVMFPVTRQNFNNTIISCSDGVQTFRPTLLFSGCRHFVP